MFSRSFKLFSIVVVMALLLSLSGAASAGTRFQDQPEPPFYPQGYRPPVSIPMDRLDRHSAGLGAVVTPGDGQVSAQAAVLGKPGTVFGFARTFGETEIPYAADFSHIYHPNGLDFADTGELYVVEENGARLIKYDTFDSWSLNPTPLWSMGKAGVHDWGQTALNYPKEVAAAPDGNSVWVADGDIISQFDAVTRDLIQRVPEKPWEEPDDAFRFGEARGIDFDTVGNMYVSDMKRQRVMVYSFDGDGKPVHQATIENFESPSQIAIDGDDTLFVADVFSYTIKKCEPDKTPGWPWIWDCEVFFGVPYEQGNSSDNTHLGMPYGIGLNKVHHVLYIADGWSTNVVRCTIEDTPSCDAIIEGLGWPADVASDPADHTITVSDYGWNAVYRFFGEGSLPPGAQIGFPLPPWISNDPAHAPYGNDPDPLRMLFNMPVGVEVDALGNLFVLEEDGQRLTKLDKNGNFMWGLGVPGISNWDDTDLLDSPKMVAIDRRNILIVAGGGNHVRTYNALTGVYMDTLDQGGGNGNFNFEDAWGVATDASNYIYVSDQRNNRVMVYTYNPLATTNKFRFIRQVGLGGECGNSNTQFCSPRGIFVDALKNLYVADHDNCRVQMFNSLGVYKKTYGNGMCRDTFASVGGPTDVAVDALGRVYVVEEWNARVNVFEKTGAYLTTIAGTWGSTNNSMRNPRAIALDKQGNAYVADSINSRVQKFNLTVPYWTQVNINGFGNRRVTKLTSLGMFKGVMYAGGTNENNQAAIWKRVGTSWIPVMSDGFEDGANNGVNHLLEYKGYLYAATSNCTSENCETSNGGQLWRSVDGLDWQVVVADGFRDPGNAELFRLAVLGGKLCVSTWRYDGNGTQLWCSTTGEIGTWQLAVADGFGNGSNQVILSMVDYKSPLPTNVTASYASTWNQDGYAQVWRRVAGETDWQHTDPTWPTDGRYFAASALTAYKNYLYVIVRTRHVDTLTDVGATIYRCQVCDGSDWNEVLPEAMQDVDSFRGYGLEATPYGLYAFFGNREKGVDILWSKDGTTWTRPFLSGMGSKANAITYWDNATLWVGTNLYLGLYNEENGAGVWKLCPLTKLCK